MNMLSDNSRGALLMIFGMAAFSLNDAMMKQVSPDMGLYQAIFLRGIAATVLLGTFAWSRGAFAQLPDSHSRRLILLRSMAEVGATLCFLLALFNMPLANATAILQSAPLAITLAGAVFLREQVGWRRYLATAIGFTGVLLIVRPGPDGFNLFALAALFSVFFIVLRDLTTRRLSQAVPSLMVASATAFSVTLAGGVGCLVTDWTPVSPGILTELWGAAFFLLIGYVFGVMAMRVGQISVISPFRYSVMLFALLLGYLFFGEVPDGLTLIGCGIVVGTGLFTLYREQRAARRG